MAFVIMHLRSHLKLPTKKTILSDFHRELCSLTRFKRVAIAAPRGHGKSSYLSFFYPLYAALDAPGASIVLLSATSSLAEELLGKIRKEIELSPSLLKRYGDQVGDKWTNDEIRLKNGSVIMAKGSGKQVRGFRPDIIILDDSETEEMVVSTDQRNKFEKWVWAEVLGTLKPDGQLIVVGTILHPESFLSDLITKHKGTWETKLYQAITPNGTSLWEEGWPLTELSRRRIEMGTYLFEQEYQNNPIPDDKRIFQKSWIKYYDKVPASAIYFTTIDPAIELSDKNDYTAIVTVAVDASENIFVVDIIHKRMLPDETIDAIFEMYKLYKPAVIGIEDIGFQKMLRLELEKQRKDRQLYPVIKSLKSEGVRKSLRIEAMQPRFQAGKVFIKEEMKNLETELLSFPSPRCHDDIIDALAYVLKIMRPAHIGEVQLNPNSFFADLERNRKASKTKGWGSHKIMNTTG